MTHERFEQAVLQYKGKLFRLANCILRNEHDAQDAVCEAVYKAFREIGSLRDEHAFHSWIYRITINEANRMLRSRKNTVDISAARNITAREEKRPQLVDYIAKLPDDMRIPIYLFYYEDMPICGIAQVIDIPENTVKSRLRRAKEQLRRMIPYEEVLENGF